MVYLQADSLYEYIIMVILRYKTSHVNQKYTNRTGGVMVSVLASSGIDRGFETMQLVFVASPLSTQH
jgi:hypothetical protein